MKLHLALMGLFLAGELLADEKKDARVYEMRIYHAAQGKLDALNARFRQHTTRLFEKHGMTNIGYWVPVNNEENRLIYILAYPSQEAREQAWKAFRADPEWLAAKAASEKDGTLVDRVESLFLKATDYSPAIKPAVKGSRVFELRTYTAEPGRLDDLHARFRDHTIKLFEKYGITNIGYWSLQKGQKGIEVTLIYILAHDSEDAARESFEAFRKDPAWLAARKASEEKAGGSLTAPGGVKSLFLRPTDYSPTR